MKIRSLSIIVFCRIWNNTKELPYFSLQLCLIDSYEKDKTRTIAAGKRHPRNFLTGANSTFLPGCVWTVSTWPSIRSLGSWTWIWSFAVCLMRICPTTCGPLSVASCCTCTWTGIPRSRSRLSNMPVFGLRSPLKLQSMSEYIPVASSDAGEFFCMWLWLCLTSYDNDGTSRDEIKERFCLTMDFVENYLREVVSQNVPFSDKEKNKLTFEVFSLESSTYFYQHKATNGHLCLVDFLLCSVTMLLSNSFDTTGKAVLPPLHTHTHTLEIMPCMQGACMYEMSNTTMRSSKMCQIWTVFGK